MKRLTEALDPTQRPMFSTWPEDSKPPTIPDFDALHAQLAELTVFADYLRRCLRYQQSEDAGHSQEIRAMLVYDIVRALVEIVPEVPPSRGTYDAEEIHIVCQRIAMYDFALHSVQKHVHEAQAVSVSFDLDRLEARRIANVGGAIMPFPDV